MTVLVAALLASFLGRCRGANGPQDEAQESELHVCALLQMGIRTEGAEDFGLDEGTWLGLEREEEEALAASPQRLPLAIAPPSLAVNVPLQQAEPPILYMGLWNTGTNLLWELLLKNFGPLRGSRAVGMDVWRHSKPADAMECYQDKQGAFKDMVTVAVVRNPLSWIQSMRKAPYELEGCASSDHWDGSDRWATADCKFVVRCLNPQRGYTREVHASNIESVWNEWTSQYNRLHQLGFGAPVVISYEELVLDTAGALSKIAAAMRVPAPTVLKQQYGPAKVHGESNGRAAALMKLEKKSYLDMYTEETRREVCARLDRPIMRAHGYHDCDGW
uniref:Sulfotransferase domain-containing protein n=1 Tax=Pyrodinium bahamense TaxID=73915 RepID=A0A7S0FBV3_9DINO|mmetsp:Transcript_19852/g.54633  ORF Transcript_19852/g.54633 Transcript_19852/m.54633 type:complete len:332 (+) Transcript_19852:112-1107(+)